MSRKVILFYPLYEGTPLGVPLCFPGEIRLADLSGQPVRRRSLIDGKELPTEAVNVC